MLPCLLLSQYWIVLYDFLSFKLPVENLLLMVIELLYHSVVSAEELVHSHDIVSKWWMQALLNCYSLRFRVACRVVMVEWVSAI